MIRLLSFSIVAVFALNCCFLACTDAQATGFTVSLARDVFKEKLTEVFSVKYLRPRIHGGGPVLFSGDLFAPASPSSMLESSHDASQQLLLEATLNVEKRTTGDDNSSDVFLFPPALNRILHSSDGSIDRGWRLRELELTLANGRWSHENSNDAETAPTHLPQGTTISACFVRTKPDISASQQQQRPQQQWQKLVQLVGSLSSTTLALAFHGDATTAARRMPLYMRHGGVATSDEDATCFFVHAPKESLCTENLSPLLRLFHSTVATKTASSSPSTKSQENEAEPRPAGFLSHESDLVPRVEELFSSPYTALRLQLVSSSSSSPTHNASVSIQYVDSVKRFKERLQRAKGNAASSLSSRSEARLFLKQQQQPKTIVTAPSANNASLQRQLLDLVGQTKEVEEDGSSDVPATSSDHRLEVAAHIIQKDEVEGTLRIDLDVSSPQREVKARAFVLRSLLILPRHLITPKLHTLTSTCVSASSETDAQQQQQQRHNTSLRTARVDVATNTLAVIVDVATEEALLLPVRVSLSLRVAFPHLHIDDYPPDANQPYTLPSVHATLLLPGLRASKREVKRPPLSVLHDMMGKQEGPRVLATAFTEPVAFYRPVPDVAMTFNVAIIANTVFAILLTAVFVVTVREKSKRDE